MNTEVIETHIYRGRTSRLDDQSSVSFSGVIPIRDDVQQLIGLLTLGG